jgi:hypothetical protein
MRKKGDHEEISANVVFAGVGEEEAYLSDCE